MALMSGRQAENLDRWFGAIKGMWLIAEHGAELKSPRSNSWEPLRAQAADRVEIYRDADFGAFR